MGVDLQQDGDAVPGAAGDLGRGDAERVLEERARPLGADIRYGTEVTGLTQHPGGLEVKVRQDGHPDRAVRARYVVGADGMDSTVRRALGMPFRQARGAVGDAGRGTPDPAAPPTC